MTGAFWGSFGITLVPFFNAYGAYVTDPEQAAAQMGNPGNPLGLQNPAFNASFAFFLLYMGLICLIFLIMSVRTNAVFFIIFLTLVSAPSASALRETAGTVKDERGRARKERRPRR